ncbi:hypothetical protein [Nonomuraea sp. NPDC049646]|uniref:hypothetical protein n=1 Tax=unclassified Nonomuraea TaxID=2593643 RepID=UPI0037A945F3
MTTNVVRGDDLLDHVLRTNFPGHDLLSAPVQPLLEKVSLWLPLEVYREWPIMLPWALRDLGCRGNKRDRPDIWSSPAPTGHFLDDNTMVKGLVRTVSVRSPDRCINGKRLRGGFVAAHIWRVVRHHQLASRIPALYTFVPNLVWLPGDVAKLTDREGSVYQRTLQAMSSLIYQDAPVRPSLKGIVKASWDMLPVSDLPVTAPLPEELSWFNPGPAFFKLRRTRLDEVLAALRTLEGGKPLVRKVIATRFTKGLPQVPPGVRAEFLADLSRFEIVP